MLLEPEITRTTSPAAPQKRKARTEDRNNITELLSEATGVSKSSSRPKKKTAPNKKPVKEGQYVPSDRDVVLGKGKLIQELSGNVRFRNMIRMLFHRYESLESPHDKTFLAMDTVENIREGGGRFLKEVQEAIERLIASLLATRSHLRFTAAVVMKRKPQESSEDHKSTSAGVV